MSAVDIPLIDGPIEVRNALGFDRSDTGVSPRRLPDWTRPQIPDVMVEAMVRMSSGVRLALRTDSPFVEVVLALTSFRADGQEPRVHGVDLVVDGVVEHQATTAGGNRFVLDMITRAVLGFEPGDPVTLRWELDGEAHDVEIWLPTAASVEIQAVRVASGATVEPPAPSARRRWVHYGSSISHCMEVTHPTETWPVLAARASGVDVVNLGLAGQCHLDPFVARTVRDLDPDLVSIKVGINVINMDSMKERIFVPALHGFIDTLRERHPDLPVLVVSPIFCPVAEDHPGPTIPTRDGRYRVIDGPEALRLGALTLQRVRTLIAELVAGRRADGDAHLHALDGTELFAEADWAAGDMPDDLHPNPAGYRRMGERFAAHAFGPDGAFRPR